MKSGMETIMRKTILALILIWMPVSGFAAFKDYGSFNARAMGMGTVLFQLPTMYQPLPTILRVFPRSMIISFYAIIPGLLRALNW